MPMTTKLSLCLIVSILTAGCVDHSHRPENGPISTNKVDVLTTSVYPEPDSSNIEIAQGVIVNEILIHQIQKHTPLTDHQGQLKINSFVQLINNVSYILYEISDGVSSTDYIMSFSDNDYMDYEILGRSVDMDLSFPHYEYSELRQSELNKFRTVHFTQTPKDEGTVDGKTGWFKDGFSFDDVEIQTDSITTWLTVTTNGIIERDTVKL